MRFLGPTALLGRRWSRVNDGTLRRQHPSSSEPLPMASAIKLPVSSDINSERDEHDHSRGKDAMVVPVDSTLLAALVLHAPGLWCLMKYNDNLLVLLGGFFGALCEGVCFLLLLTHLATRCRYQWADLKQKSQKSWYSPHFWKSTTFFFVSLLPSLLLVGMFTFFSAGEYFFHDSTGGIRPSMWVIVVAMNEASAHLEFVQDGNWEYVQSHAFPMCACICAGLIIHVAGFYSSSITRRRVVEKMDIVKVGLIAVAAYASGCWSPVIHCSLSFLGQFILSAEGVTIVKKAAEVQSVSPEALEKAKTAPNVIFIVHDSLSGSIARNTELGRNATPFFNSLLEDDDMYFLRHARAVSGDTQGGITALLGGCIPFTEQGREMVFGQSLGTEFKKMGRQTATYSTTMLDNENDKYFMVDHYLRSNMDTVVTASSLGHKMVNVEGSDDRWFLPHFKDWIQNVSTSFYAQFYWFNTHYPYLRDDSTSQFKEKSLRMFSSLETFDDSLKQLFGVLRETGQLNNTIIIGSSDHGESPKNVYSRISNLEPHILHTLTYMHIPRHLFPSSTSQKTLRNNVDKVVSILDLFPSVQHILYGGNVSSTSMERVAVGAASLRSKEWQRHCITGMDLLSENVPDNRLALSWNTVTEPESKQLLVALSNAERGLYLRRGYPTPSWLMTILFPLGSLSPRGLFEFTYDQCTVEVDNQCTAELDNDEMDLAYWQGIVRGMHESPAFSKYALDTIFMKEIKTYLKLE
jgi:hypothetical protein